MSLTRRLEEGNTKGDIVAGAAIGKLFRLLRLPIEYVEDVAQMMNRFWRFVSGDDLTDYLRGVWEGFEPSSTPKQLNQVNSPFRPRSKKNTIPQQSLASGERTEDFLSAGVSSSSPGFNETESALRASNHTDPIHIDDDDDFILIDTSCPSRRLKKTRGPVKIAVEHTASEVSKKFSNPQRARPVLKEPQPQLLTPGSSPMKRKRSTFNIEPYKPETNSWSPVQQNPTKRAVVHSGSQENNYIVIDDDVDHELDEKQEDQDVDDTASVIDFDGAPPSPASSAATLRDLTADEQFDLDRARVTRMMAYNWAQFYKILQETAAEEPASASSSSSSFASASSYYSLD